MKNLRWVFFFGVALILLLTFQAQAQEVVETATKTSWFQNIWNNAKESGIWVVVMYIAGILSKNGVTKIIKAVAGKTAIGTEVGVNVLQSVHNLADLIDKSIKDDNTVDENTLKQAIDAGKAVVTTFNDAIVTIKPKPVVPTPAV